MNFVFFLFTLATALPAHADSGVAGRAWAGAAEATSYLAKGGCPAVAEAEALRALKSDRDCRPPNHRTGVDQIGALAERATTTSEDALFAALAPRHADELACGARFADQLAQGESAAVTDVADKLKLMRAARRVWVQSTKDLREGRGTAGRFCPTTLGELDTSANGDQKTNATCTKIIKAKAAFALAQNAIPLVGEPNVASAVKQYAERDDDPSEDALASLIKSTYAKTGGTLREQSEKLRARAAAKGGASFSAEERRTLLSDPLVTESVVRTNRAVLEGVACRADARFGRGAELRDGVVDVGALALGGAAAATFRGAAFLGRSAYAVNAARAAGQVSLTTARMLQAGAAVATTTAALTEIKATCGHGDLALKARAQAGGCVSAPKIENLRADSCALAASLSALDVAGVLPASSLAKYAAFGALFRKLKPVEAFAAGEAVTFRTSSGTLRSGSVERLEGKSDALVRWRDPETGLEKQKIVPVGELGRGLPLANDARVDEFRRAFNEQRFDVGSRSISFDDGVSRQAARVVDRTADGGLEVETIGRGGVERRTLTPEQVLTARASSVAASPDFFATYNKSLFQRQPTFTQNAQQSMNRRTYSDSSGPRVVEIVNDHRYREAAVARGDLVEHKRPAKLPPGEYTYVVLEDGSMVTGRVHDNFEVGVKHTHLADGRAVLVAGELKIAETGRAQFNIESGSFTRNLIEKKGADPAQLSERAGRALGLLTGETPESTKRLFWNDRSPDRRALGGYCGDRYFYTYNRDVCRGSLPAGH